MPAIYRTKPGTRRYGGHAWRLSVVDLPGSRAGGTLDFRAVASRLRAPGARSVRAPGRLSRDLRNRADRDRARRAAVLGTEWGRSRLRPRSVPNSALKPL